MWSGRHVVLSVCAWRVVLLELAAPCTRGSCLLLFLSLVQPLHNAPHCFLVSALPTLAATTTTLPYQGIKIVTVDNPHTVEGLIKKTLPGVEVKMDAGHVLFSRLGKLLDKKHALQGDWRV